MNKTRMPVALITGVSSGIGLAAAQLFVSRDWIVVGTVRGDKTKSLHDVNVDIQLAEMNNPDDLQRVVAELFSTYGRLDALICNAGYALTGPVDSFDYDQIRDQYLTNVIAPAELSRLVIPMMKEQGSGSLVFVSSIVGRIGLPGFGIYSSSKWALEGLAESLALELDRNIRVKLVEPSGVNTEFWSSLMRGAGRPWKNTELGRIGNEPDRQNHGLSPQKVAEKIYIAATDNSSKLRYPVGQTGIVAFAKRIIPDRLFLYVLKRVMR